MQSIVDDLLANGEPLLEDLVEQKKQETLELEFKTKEDPGHGSASKTDKKKLGEALSGFSNSMGGALIWGVDARPDDDGVDCVVRLKPIREIAKFESQVRTLTGELLAPKNETVQIHTIPSKEQGSGYLLVLVERSERRPHMSLAPQDRRYYKRSGTSFYMMEHFDVEDAFNRRSVAKLEVFHKWRVTRRPDRVRGELGVGIANKTQVPARFPYLHFDYVLGASLSPYGIDGATNFGLPRKPTGDSTILFAGGANDILHATQQQLICHFTLELRRPTSLEALNPVVVAYKCGCAGSAALEGCIEFSVDDLFSQFGR